MGPLYPNTPWTLIKSIRIFLIYHIVVIKYMLSIYITLKSFQFIYLFIVQFILSEVFPDNSSFKLKISSTWLIPFSAFPDIYFKNALYFLLLSSTFV